MDGLLPIIVFAPLAGAVVNGAIALGYSHKEKGPREAAVSFIGCLAPLVSFAAAILVFRYFLGADVESPAVTKVLFPWIVSGALHLDFAFYVDALSIVMVLVVTGIGTIIHFYSIGYMHGDRGYARYFAYLNLFMFAMLTLVTARNLPLLFVGWEGVGLCSYLLIGFWYEDVEKAAAGKKAFIVNRIGDLAFLLGMFLIFAVTTRAGHGTLDIAEFRGMVVRGGFDFAALATAAGILLFIGACGKSAQIPLYVWLPDAMAGPTPVSALIHAATMVTAGVYMVARLSFMYSLSPVAMGIVACVGALTALFAATIGICQVDIKKVLAYSTISQLGYMFVAVGVGAYAAGIFHLMTHAFFKACLFLGAGSVIHAMSGEQDMLKMGALSKKMKVTAATFLAASLAISGIPPFSGFFSKDEILWSAFSSSLSPAWLPRLLWVITYVAAGVTAFYIFRAVFLTFYGKRRYSDEAAHHLHESPRVMTIPLVLLAAGSLLAGFVGVPGILGGGNRFHAFLAPVTGEGHAPGGGHAAAGEAARASLEHASSAVEHAASGGLEATLMVLSVIAGLIGIFIAYRLYLRNPEAPAAITRKLKGLHKLVYNKYYVDEIYERSIVKPGFTFSQKALFGIFDVRIIDGIVNTLGITVRFMGSVVRLLETGVVRTYAFFMLIGFLYLLFKMVI
jgi:NADH-quinone oxidoreductase subunit L